MGKAQVERHTYTLIHYYDLNLIIQETNKLRVLSKLLRELLNRSNEYSIDTSNYWKLPSFIEGKVEDKLTEILPHPQRIKRGLINGLGSIFKQITGNLDANDGERYDTLIRELQNNQINLASAVKKQSSFSVALIDKFNKTIQQITHNEGLLESKVKQIALIVRGQTYKKIRFL